MERRWNKKLEEFETRKREIEGMTSEGYTLTDEDKEEILSIGERFEEIWEDKGCPVDLKKKLIRTIIEEVIAYLDKERDLVRFVIHWKGGTHTQFEMKRPKSPVGKKTSMGDLEIIRKRNQ